MLNSVRIRITLWYVVVLALTLVVFASGVYGMLRRSLYARLDGGLRSALEVTTLSLNHETEEHNGKQPGEESFRTVLATMTQTSFPLQGIAVFDGDRLVSSKAGENGMVPEYRTVPPGTKLTIASSGNLRTAYQIAKVPFSQAEYLVIATQRLDATEHELRSVRDILLIAIPFALALAAAGGYYLARKSLAPVVMMASSANRISSANLDARISVKNKEDELGQLALTFNRLLERLQKAFYQQRQFMADASHELKTPVSVALLTAQVTLERPHRTEEEYLDALDVVRREMERLATVVQNMFLLARADAGAFAISRQDCYLDEVILEAVKAASVLGRKKGISIHVGELPESPLSADEQLIRQLVLILLDNAVKFSPGASRIEVSLGSAGSSYRVEVKDQGQGIPEDAREQIFSRFFRLDVARSEDGGAGLGLSIARWITDLHGGTIELTKSDSKGSVFTVLLPYAKIFPETTPAISVGRKSRPTQWA
jgi:heavy metal sensor kinase